MPAYPRGSEHSAPRSTGPAPFASARQDTPDQFMPNPRIALLPPLIRKAKAAEVALARALIDDITMGLCAMRTVSVVAPHTASCLRNEQDWLGHLERNKVQYILDARSTPEGLLLQLVFLPSDTMIWAARYALHIAFLPDQRREIARAVTLQLAQELERNEVFYADYVRNARAYHLYLKGLDRLKAVTLADSLWAREAFLQALEEHKDFAPALSGLSRTFTMEWLLRGRDDPALLEAAEKAACEAIRQNPLSPLGHRERGVARLYQGAVEESVEALSTSVGLGPHYADAIYSLADSLVHASRPLEGLTTIERAIALNFLPPDTYLWSAAGACFFLERYEEAIDFIQRMTVSAPAARLAAAAWGMLDNAQEAAAERRRVLQLNPDFELETWLSTIPIKERWQKDMYRTGLKKAGF
jgi:tetratricopeptide (TPR) repeat protein